MLGQPSLDRFSQPGPNEKKYHGVKVLLLLPECHICGHEVDPRFLKPYNGVDACTYCIKDINEEAEQYEFHNHDSR
jgi:hypothetical protein